MPIFFEDILLLMTELLEAQMKQNKKQTSGMLHLERNVLAPKLHPPMQTAWEAKKPPLLRVPSKDGKDRLVTRGH